MKQKIEANPWLLKILPKFNETKLFLIGISFFVLLFTNENLMQFMINLSGEDYATFIIISIGALFSVLFAFYPKKTPVFSKRIMLGSAIFMNIIISAMTAEYLFNEKKWIFMILPAINFFHAAISLVISDERLINIYFPDTQSRTVQVMTGIIAILLIAGFCKVNGFDWKISYSLCIMFSQLFLDVIVEPIEKILFRKSLQKKV